MGETADSCSAQPHNRIREAGNHLRTGHEQTGAPQEVFHTQCGYKRMRQMQPGQQQAVDQTDSSTCNERGYNQNDGVGHAFADQHTDHAGTEYCICTNRQVNACGNQTQKHAGRTQCSKGCLLKNGHDIVIAQKLIAGNRQNNAQNKQCSYCADILAKAA